MIPRLTVKLYVRVTPVFGIEPLELGSLFFTVRLPHGMPVEFEERNWGRNGEATKDESGGVFWRRELRAAVR